MWGTPFNHNTPTGNTGVYTNPNTPWGASPAVNSMQPGPSQAFFVFAGETYDFSVPLNAVHMALIPKGPFQGHVIVWDDQPVMTNEPPGLPVLASGTYRSCTPFSIIDPSPTLAAGQIRYRNFLLPMENTYAVDLASPNIDAEGLFCSGHVWSPYGDLVIVGGTLYRPAYTGATFCYVFNPEQPWAPYPGTSTPMYPGVGFWRREVDLESARWYPTATLTYPLPRILPVPAEVILVSGGSDIDPNIVGPGPQVTWNDLESLVVDGPAIPAGALALRKDVINPGAGPVAQFIAPGPGLISPAVDWLEEYPRCHLLSSGRMFYSGYAPRWSYFDPNMVPVVWTRAPGPLFSSNWQNPRHDAPSLLFPNIAPDEVDRILRLGGGDTHFYFAPPRVPSVAGTTETVESIDAGATPVGPWQAEPSLPVAIAPVLPGQLPTDPSLGGRYLTNAVTLPTGGILVFGGQNRTPQPGAGFPPSTVTNVFEAFLFEGGAWVSMGKNPVPSPRDYHSNGVLLPDGRVFIGGGNGRQWDYEIFSPPYRTQALLLAQKPTNVAFTVPAPPFNTAFDAFGLDYNTNYTVSCNRLPTGVVLKSAVLMAPGSNTHHSDMSARYVGMTVIDESSRKIAFLTPPNPRYAPRGIYMLFVVTNTGAVSDALWVRLS